MEGTVVGRLVVDADGKVLDIKFQAGAESPQLQSKVREFFIANPPQADKQLISSYPFQLKFQNNPNATGVSSKIQPPATSNTEKVFEPQIKPSVTPNSQKLPPETPPVNDLGSITSATPNSNAPAVSTESSKKLIQTLRQIKEQRKNP